ncbi:MAG: Beta-lactamase domain protein, partial [Nocardioidaceae bacterium]|nr:Beta-lactamase domain protein [Nocardioidaceae bacterium]
LIGDLVHTQPELFEIGWDSTSNVDSAAAHASIERMRNLILKRDIPFAAAHFPGMHWGKLVTSGGKVGYEELPD